MQEFVNDNMAEPLETNGQTRLELARILHYILRLLQSDYIDEISLIVCSIALTGFTILW